MKLLDIINEQEDIIPQTLIDTFYKRIEKKNKKWGKRK